MQYHITPIIYQGLYSDTRIRSDTIPTGFPDNQLLDSWAESHVWKDLKGLENRSRQHNITITLYTHASTVITVRNDDTSSMQSDTTPHRQYTLTMNALNTWTQWMQAPTTAHRTTEIGTHHSIIFYSSTERFIPLDFIQLRIAW